MAEYFEAIASWPMSRAINESSWIFAFIQAFHLAALAFLAGALLIVDLRLLGKGFTQQPVAQVARDARPWLLASIAAMILTGVPQLMSLATKEYNSEFFWNKMYFLAAALIFTFTVREKVVRAPEGRVGRGVSSLVAIVSIVLWAGVAVEARLIGLFS
jgi:hypothetical protein